MDIIKQIDEANQQITVFIVPDNSEHTYENVGTIYNTLHLGNRNWPVFLLDVEGSSRELISPRRSITLEELQKLDIHNPNRYYVFIIQDHKEANIIALKESLGLQGKYTPAELEELTIKTGVNPAYLYREQVGQRAFGTGARVYFVLCVDYMTRFHRNWQSMAEVAAFNFDGYFIRGSASLQLFNNCARNFPLILNKGRVQAYPTVATDLACVNKKLKVCYTETIFRFMSSHNIRFFFSSIAPELAEQVEFVNLSEARLNEARNHLADSAVFLALDMGVEYANLVPEAMLTGNLVLGFSGAYDSQAMVDQFADFSPEGDYRDVAQKLVKYLLQYKEALAGNPNYLHPQAFRAKMFAEETFSVDKLADSYLALLRALHINAS